MADDPPEAHDELARRFRDPEDSEVTTPWRELPIKKYIEWPAVRELLPPVSDKRVMDAGCGDGATIKWLLAQGADAVGVDASQESIAWAKENVQENVGHGGEFVHADLREPLEFAAEEEFDLIVSEYTFNLIENLHHVFQEFYRILSPGGHLVFSMEHPMREFHGYDDVESYFDTTQRAQDWGYTSVTTHFRPLADVLNPLADADFRLEQFVEPAPREEMEAEFPEMYEREKKSPRIFCVRARKFDE